jgi:peptidoglycan/LPS O-acetylase OafA/YrhL
MGEKPQSGSSINLPSQREERPRIPALDGIRGLAILMVFAGHVAAFGPNARESASRVAAFLSLNRGIGVDLFFVLSGFLITGILYDAKGSQRYFRIFYARRTLRIFPLYYSFLAVVLIASMLFPQVHALGSISAGAHVANWTYTSNFFIAAQGWNAEPLFLLPFWSLAVEEQFYLFWPLFVRRAGREWLIKICVIGFVGAFLIRTFLLWKGQEVAAYALLPSRMDALLVGATLALAVRGGGIGDWLGSKAMLVACWLAFALDLATAGASTTGSALRYAAHFTVAALAFGSLLMVVAQERHSLWLGTFFRFSLLRSLGKYSYAIYVFHVAVITVLPKIIRRVATVPEGLVFGVIALAVCMILALCSWHLIENPFLGLRSRLQDTS